MWDKSQFRKSDEVYKLILDNGVMKSVNFPRHQEGGKKKGGENELEFFSTVGRGWAHPTEMFALLLLILGWWCGHLLVFTIQNSFRKWILRVGLDEEDLARPRDSISSSITYNSNHHMGGDSFKNPSREAWQRLQTRALEKARKGARKMGFRVWANGIQSLSQWDSEFEPES